MRLRRLMIFRGGSSISPPLPAPSTTFQVIDGLEEGSWRVIRWDPDGLVLLEPCPSAGEGDNSTDCARRRGTRWAFHQDLRAAQAASDRRDAPHASIAVTTLSSPPTSTVMPTFSSGGPAAPDPGGCDLEILTPTSFNPNPFARRAAKLDKRVVFRVDAAKPERGRGLFATKDVPEGTEVMRVRAVGTVALRVRSAGVCCRCFVQQKRSARLKTCRGCGLSFCTDCAKAFLNNSAHKAACDFSAGVVRLCSRNGGVEHDEAVLRLVADIFVRKEAGLIDEEEWNLLGSLESGGNESGTIGLSLSLLKDSVRLFRETLRIEVSEGGLQTMYRRVTRNLHAISPVFDDIGSGVTTAQALFPCGALVNHSCQPNALFHCRSRPLSTDGPVVEHVLRTVSPVKAGEELCVSYITDFATASISERRRLLQGWGFWCACSRCKNEEREAQEERREKRARPGDTKALSCIRNMEKTLQLYARDGAGDIGVKQLDQLREAIQFFAEEGERITPTLRRRLVMSAMHLTLLMDGEADVSRFVALQAAGDELMELKDPGMIDLRYKLYKEALGLREVEPFFEESARRALEDAVAMSKLMYGKQHPRSRELTREFDKL